MHELTEDVRRVALEAGADLVGFAPIARFETAPESVHPRTIFPPTRTVIAIAIRQPRGTLKAVEEGTYWQAYNCDAYWYLNEVKAPEVLRKIVMHLEARGATSVPVHNPFFAHMGKQIREDQPYGPDGIVSLRMLGVAAGLGELGRSKIFLTPQFGPRQRVFGVFTDAELEPTPLLEQHVCDDCGACAAACEADAIGDERTETMTIDGREFSHAPLDCAACSRVHQGRDRRFSPFWRGDEPEDADWPEFNKRIYARFNHLAVCVGRGCLRACLDHLEKAGRIEATFNSPLIERERWKVEP